MRRVRVGALCLVAVAALPAGARAASHSAHSLYHGPAPRPGPAILYRKPARSPQLENAGVWHAKPILVSGASAYRDGEFLYQDFLYDDHGARGTAPDPGDPRIERRHLLGAQRHLHLPDQTRTTRATPPTWWSCGSSRCAGPPRSGSP